MTPLDAIPSSSISWLIGMAACSIVGVRSLLVYRQFRVELSKYMAWFGILVSIALGFFSIPAFFTLNFDVLHVYYIIGQFFFFCSMIAQAGIVWCLLLRSRLSIYYLAIPVGLIGFASWLYAVPRSYLLTVDGFMQYFDPRATTLGIAVLLIGLFVPVGLYFLRVAPRQKGFKAMFTSVAFGVAYIGIGLITGGFELLTGQIMTRTSVFGNDIFFTFLLIAALWPRRNVFSSPPAVVSGNDASVRR